MLEELTTCDKDRQDTRKAVLDLKETQVNLRVKKYVYGQLCPLEIPDWYMLRCRTGITVTNHKSVYQLKYYGIWQRDAC